jgi:hypothetical protein
MTARTARRPTRRVSPTDPLSGRQLDRLAEQLRASAARKRREADADDAEAARVFAAYSRYGCKSCDSALIIPQRGGRLIVEAATVQHELGCPA